MIRGTFCRVCFHQWIIGNRHPKKIFFLRYRFYRARKADHFCSQPQNHQTWFCGRKGRFSLIGWCFCDVIASVALQSSYGGMKKNGHHGWDYFFPGIFHTVEESKNYLQFFESNYPSSRIFLIGQKIFSRFFPRCLPRSSLYVLRGKLAEKFL